MVKNLINEIEQAMLNRSNIDYNNRECIVTGKGDKQRKAINTIPQIIRKIRF